MKRNQILIVERETEQERFESDRRDEAVGRGTWKEGQRPSQHVVCNYLRENMADTAQKKGN